MKQITTSKGIYLSVPIVKDSEHLIVDDGHLCYLPPVPKGYSVSTMKYVELPSTKYTFICTTDTITEDIAKGICEHSISHFDGKLHDMWQFNNSGSCNSSAVRAVQIGIIDLIDTNKTYAICKKIN